MPSFGPLKELNIENASVDDRAGLIYEILDKQAIVGSANSKKQSGETSAKKGRSRITVKKEANNVYIYYKMQVLQLCHFIALCDCILR